MNGGKSYASAPTKPGFGVRYVLPQNVHVCEEDVSLFQRVSPPLGNVKFTVQSGDTVLATAKRLRIAPGEMEKLTIKADLMKNVSEAITCVICPWLHYDCRHPG